MIEKSVDWNKVVELILKVIPPKSVEKIKIFEDATRLDKYKYLVDFLISKLEYTQTNQIKYLAYWRTEDKIANIQFTAKSLPVWVKWAGGIAAFLIVVGLIWGEDGLGVVFSIAGFIAFFGVLGWLRN